MVSFISYYTLIVTLWTSYGFQLPELSIEVKSSLPTPLDIIAADSALFVEHDNDSMNALFKPSAAEQSTPIRISSEDSLRFASDLPADFPPGILCRIGPNPQPGHSCPSFLDGDGMIHAVTIPPRKPALRTEWESTSPQYSRTYVRAVGFSMEADEEGRQLFAGTLVAPRGWPMLAALARNMIGSKGKLIQKDTANTALSWHGGRLLALMEQSRPTQLRLKKTGKVETVLAGTDLDGSIPFAPVTGGALSAHSRLDPATGTLVAVSYSTAVPPYVRVDEFGRDGSLVSSVGVDTPAPVMVHDCAITPSHAVVLDFPMTVKVARTLFDRFPVEYEPKSGARLGFIPRQSNEGSAIASGDGKNSNSPIAWVDVKPCVALHTCNAYHAKQPLQPAAPTRERANADESSASPSAYTWVVVTGLRSQPKGPQSFICEYTPAFLYEWTVEIPTKSTLASGSSSSVASEIARGKLVSERYLSSVPCEFPIINPSFNGKEARFVYCIAPLSAGGPISHGYKTPQQAILIDGILKLDLSTGETLGEWRTKNGREDQEGGGVGSFIVSEPTFVARQRMSSTKKDVQEREDDGFILLIVTDVARSKTPKEAAHRVPNGSSMLVFDARDLNKGPVATLPLPADIPYGLHSCFVPWGDLTDE